MADDKTDFYAAYHPIPGRHQRCWVHLLCDLHDLKQAQPTNPAVAPWATAVRELHDEAQAWLAAYPAPTLAERRRACRVVRTGLRFGRAIRPDR